MEDADPHRQVLWSTALRWSRWLMVVYTVAMGAYLLITGVVAVASRGRGRVLVLGCVAIAGLMVLLPVGGRRVADAVVRDGHWAVPSRRLAGQDPDRSGADPCGRT